MAPGDNSDARFNSQTTPSHSENWRTISFDVGGSFLSKQNQILDQEV